MRKLVWLTLLTGFFAFSMGSFAQKAPSGWAIVGSWTIPGKASGLAWSGTYIYFGIYGSNGNEIYKFDPSTGNATLQCTGAFGDAFGLTYKSPNLVTIDQPSSSSTPANALEFSMSGATVSTLPLPNHYMSGIAWDGSTYWVCTYYPDPGTVYNISSTGTILSQFTPPANQPWDICKQGSDLWIADYNANMLYKVSTTGTILESHASNGIKPSGVVYDGTYLWYCDGQLSSSSTLYKVDLLGTGTPAITVPVTSHNYGPVAIGTSSTWSCQVQNTGTANLSITGIGIPSGEPISTTFVTPQTIAPGNSLNVPLTYTPTAAVPLNTQVAINSNDPITPTVNVTLTGNGVYAGAHISLPTGPHNYGERRAGAYSRWYLPVTNDGSQQLTITNLSINDPHFTVDESVVLPLNVSPLGTTQIGVWFHPEEGIAYDGILTITSNAIQGSVTYGVEGDGVDTVYPMGTPLWDYTITGTYDNSIKAITPIQDITGDGVDDVIVGSEDNFFRCFNGNASVTGDVMWEVEVYSGSVYNQSSLTTMDDINSDGYREVIAGTAWGDRSVIAFSGKTGQQLWKHDSHEYGDGGWVYQVHADYDYNGDGFADVLAATGNDGNGTGPIRVYCLNGKTGISLWEYPAGGPVFSVIGVEDFTGDDIPDVVAGASNMNETAGRVFGINGDDGSLEWTYNTFGTSVWGLMQLDDVSGDGIPDVAAGDYSGTVIFLNAATGAKVYQTSVGNVLILRLQDMGDVNDDNHRDVLVSHSGTNGTVVEGKTCEILWAQPLADKSWNVANIGDVTFDGVNDAIIGTLYQNNYAYFLNGPDGEVLLSLPTGTPVDAINAIPDIVGDTTMEMVAGGRNGVLACLSGGYDTTSSPPTGVPGLEMTGSGIRLSVSPNPSSGSFTVKVTCDDPTEITLRVNDLNGRPVTGEIRVQATGGLCRQLLTLPAEVPSGVYIIEATGSAGTARGKIILTR